MTKCNETNTPAQPVSDVVEEDEDSEELDMIVREPPGKGRETPKDKDSITNKLKSLSQSMEYTIQEKFLAVYLALTSDERFLIGHSIKDFVKSCTFRGIDCRGI